MTIAIDPQDSLLVSRRVQAAYDAVMETLSRAPDAAIDHARSRVDLKLDETTSDPEPGYFGVQVWFADPTWINMDIGIDGSPSEASFWLPGVFSSIARVRIADSNEAPDLRELHQLVKDWLAGRLVLHTRLAGSVPFRWMVERDGVRVWSHRRLLFPYFAPRTVNVRCCRVAPEAFG